MSITEDDEVEWVAPKRLECRSSHETNLLLRSEGSSAPGFASSLLIDGNISKYLQGHNVFGSRDMTALVLQAFKHIYEKHEEHFSGYTNYEMTCARIKRGDFLVKMFDVNDLFDVGNDHSVESFLHAVEMKARTRTGRALRDKGAVYLQKHSRRWAIKLYNKFRELHAKGKGHKLPEYLQDIGLEDHAKGKVRLELRLMSLELKDLCLTHGYHFTEQKIAQLFSDYMGRIQMNSQFQLVDDVMLSLPRYLQSSYLLWSRGSCLKDILPEPTFYRHRKQLLEYGIDITLMRDEKTDSNVVPIIRVLEATPVATPSWAYEKGLVVC